MCVTNFSGSWHREQGAINHSETMQSEVGQEVYISVVFIQLITKI